MLKKLIGDIENILLGELPEPLAAIPRTFGSAAAICFIAGIILAIMMHTAFMFLFLAALALILCVIALVYRSNLLKNGWLQFTGTCTDHYNPVGILWRKNGADAFILDTEIGPVYVPISKRLRVPPIGSRITLYVSANAMQLVKKNGIIHFDSILGYTLLPQESGEK